jgi:hypothetical protein
LLPGWTFVYSQAEYRDGQPQQDIDWLAAATRDLCFIGQLTVHSEKAKEFRSPPAGLGVIAIERGQVLPARIRQWFAQSGAVKDRNDLYAALADEVFGGARSLTLGGVRFLILVCGENNFLTNLGRDLTIQLRHEAPGQTLADLHAIDYQVAFNPAHTEMGNDGKMHQRWRWLSRPHAANAERRCLFVTNIEEGGSRARSMYACRNEQPVELDAKQDWPEEQPWIMDVVEG